MPLNTSVTDTNIADGSVLGDGASVPAPTKTRKLALFEGTDEFGRLQPLLGTADHRKPGAGRYGRLGVLLGVRK